MSRRMNLRRRTAAHESFADTRPTAGYDLQFDAIAASAAREETVHVSPFRFQQLEPSPTAYSDSTVVLTYQQIVAMGRQLAQRPNCTMDNLGAGEDGTAMYGLRLFDDDTKPIVVVTMGIHGDERDYSVAFMNSLRHLLLGEVEGDDPVIAYARKNLSVFAVLTMNPYGIINNDRRNSNGVNLNRNWPYYWAENTDSDKGSAASSELETQNVQTWITAARQARVRAWVDGHGWTSRETWGFLYEQLYHNKEAQGLHRSAYHYANSYLSQRDFSGMTLKHGVPRFIEYRSHHKPYPTTWATNKASPNPCVGILFEYPETENAGVTCAVWEDLFKGVLAAVADHNTAAVTGNFVAPALSAPLNTALNPLLTAWNSGAGRPDFFRRNGITLTQETEGGETFVRSTRSDESAWPSEVGEGATAFSVAAGKVWVIGGRDDTNTYLSTVRSEELDAGTFKTDASLPTALNDHAACTNDPHATPTDLYVSGGVASGTTYQDTIYKATVPAVGSTISSWSSWHTMGAALQRHCMVSDGTYLYVIGGRTSSAYQTNVRRINLATKAEDAAWASLPSARGYCTAYYASTGYIYVFGGWTGSACLNEIVRIQTSTATVAVLGATLPNARRRQGIAWDEAADKVYLCMGESGTTGNFTVQQEIYIADVSAAGSETCTNSSYSMAEDDEDDDDMTSPSRPQRLQPFCFHWEVDGQTGYIGIIGGEDETGDFTDTVYEYDLDSNELYRRATSIKRWGYLRQSGVWDATDGIAPGDKVFLTTALRNPDAANDTDNPYARLVLLVGELGDLDRSVKTGYFTPPRDDWQVYTLPLILQTGETEFRAYIRHYNGGTRLDIGPVYLRKENTEGFAPIITQDGATSQDTITQTLARPLVSDGNPNVVTATVGWQGSGASSNVSYNSTSRSELQLSDTFTVPTGATNIRVRKWGWRGYDYTIDPRLALYNINFKGPTTTFAADEFSHYALADAALLGQHVLADDTSSPNSYQLRGDEVLDDLTAAKEGDILAVAFVDIGSGFGRNVRAETSGFTNGRCRGPTVTGEANQPFGKVEFFEDYRLALYADIEYELETADTDTSDDEVQAIDGFIMPAYGSQMTVDKTWVSFTCDGGYDITGLEIKYESTQDYSSGAAHGTYSSLVDYGVTGQILVRFQRNGDWVEKVAFDKPELNHYKYNREWRRDIVHWQLSTHQGNTYLKVWVYGQLYTLTLKESIKVTGYASNGVGGTVKAS